MPCLAEPSAGVTFLSDESSGERSIELSIWYPTDENAIATIGGNAVFEGAPAAPDARFPDEPLPLLVVSHGGLRSAADSGAWLSATIAQAGFVVVEVNAPRPETAAVALDEIWKRPLDISRAIDLILADREWGIRIDENRISALRFALGATAALSVAGAEMDTERYLHSCFADGGTQGPDCGWYAAQGVSLAQTSPEGLSRLTRDPRVTAAVAVHPEYLTTLNMLSSDVSTLLVSLGGEGETLDAGLGTQIAVVPNASVFDAFAACTESGPALLLEEDGDVSICGVSAKAREAVHQEVAELIKSFLDDDSR